MSARISNRVIISALIVLGTVALLILFFPYKTKGVYVNNYIVNSACFVASIILLLHLFIRDKLDLLEPIALISFLYITMYFITPIYDIAIGEYYWFGYDLFPYGIKATIIAFLGFLAFYLCYNLNSISKNKTWNPCVSKEPLPQSWTIGANSRITSFLLLMYVFCFGANAFYMVRSGGNSLVYLLSLGLLGKGKTVERTNAAIGFISMFAFCLPAITLMYIEYGKSRVLKVMLFLPMLMLQVALGFRFFVIHTTITFFAYYYLKKGKRPKLSSIILTLFALMIPVVIMTMFRNSIRGGSGLVLSQIKLNSIPKALDDAIWFNFRIYRNFYGMVNKIPSKYPYVYGQQMLIGTAVMLVPRILWPGKIPTSAGVELSLLVGSNLKGTGQAYPNIGEYYYALGLLGVIICMGIYGAWSKHIKRKLIDQENSALDIIEYSVLLGSNLQLLIRGYFPSNFWYILFSILPVIIVRRIYRERKT